MNIERKQSGTIELSLSDSPDDFLRLAERVRTALNGNWKLKADVLDQSYWDLEVEGQLITVHREHYLGVSVFCRESEASLRILTRLKEILGASVSK